MRVSVVVPSRNRPQSLVRLLAALSSQSLPKDQFEVIVVDDGSDPERRLDPEDPSIQVIRHERPRGPGAARNSGWRAARGSLIAFVDDDCVPDLRWLAALLDVRAASDAEWLIIQGRVEPDPGQRQLLTPLSHTIVVPGPDRLFACCNIAYPRSLLQHLGGFDERLTRSGEDVDLGTRALQCGAETAFAADALVYHDVRQPGLFELVRHALKWEDSVRVVSMHPELRDLLVARLFWKPTHPLLLLALAGCAARSASVRLAAWGPYLRHYLGAYRGELRALARALPQHVIVDCAEIATAASGSVRYRTLML